VVGLLGKNGAGKTTLIRIAMGMIEAQQGSVRLFGLDPRRDAVEIKRRVGYVSEEQILPPFLKVREVIRFHRSLFPDWDEGLERQLRERFDLPLDAKIKTLSKGQARQVALLCAVAHRPELLLLDEPGGGLDPAARREFLETSIQLLNESGTTILFSSHYMTDVERMAGRIVMIHEGTVILDSELDNLREKFSLVMVSKKEPGLRERLLGLDPCLSVREQKESIHAILRIDPEASATLIDREFGAAAAHCTALTLEEMFVELAGGES
jgi:ABC-2 type transport system ATP-binding protein